MVKNTNHPHSHSSNPSTAPAPTTTGQGQVTQLTQSSHTPIVHHSQSTNPNQQLAPTINDQQPNNQVSSTIIKKRHSSHSSGKSKTNASATKPNPTKTVTIQHQDNYDTHTSHGHGQTLSEQEGQGQGQAPGHNSHHHNPTHHQHQQILDYPQQPPPPHRRSHSMCSSNPSSHPNRYYNYNNHQPNYPMDNQYPQFSHSHHINPYTNISTAFPATIDRLLSLASSIILSSNSTSTHLQMYDSISDAREESANLNHLLMETAVNYRNTNILPILRSLKSLLTSITKLLLLVDSTIVHNLLWKDESQSDLIIISLQPLYSFTSFTECFIDFSEHLLRLIHSFHTQQSSNVTTTQFTIAKELLSRGCRMLIISGKTVASHPESIGARENRDTVFCQMRRGIDLIHYVLRDSMRFVVMNLTTANDDSTIKSYMNMKYNTSGLSTQISDPNVISQSTSYQSTLNYSLSQFSDSVLTLKITSADRHELILTLNNIIERLQLFTDSAYTRHEDRENILLLCERLKLQLNSSVRIAMNENENDENFNTSIDCIIKSINELKFHLQSIAINQARDLVNHTKYEGEMLIQLIKNFALTMDVGGISEVEKRWNEEIVERFREVLSLLLQISPTPSLHIQSKYTEINLRIFGPQVPIAAHVLCLNPTSKIAKENFRMFVEMWSGLMEDFEGVGRGVSEGVRRGNMGQGQQGDEDINSRGAGYYMSLPRRGKHGTTQKELNQQPTTNLPSSTFHLQNQANQPDHSLPQNMLSPSGANNDPNASPQLLADPSDPDQQLQQQQQQQQQSVQSSQDPFSSANTENNDILRRAKNMSEMAMNMYEFTKGEGTGILKTTQDLFTQGEYFAEEANRIYKVIRQFSYLVPTSPEKKDLLQRIDEIPTRVQQLQFTVKNPTVGKAATFTKVDTVINETRSLMGVISNVVKVCGDCAGKYNADLSAGDPFFFLPSSSFKSETNKNQQYSIDFSNYNSSPSNRRRRGSIYNQSSMSDTEDGGWYGGDGSGGGQGRLSSGGTGGTGSCSDGSM